MRKRQHQNYSGKNSIAYPLNKKFKQLGNCNDKNLNLTN